jgi:hypothetical protein
MKKIFISAALLSASIGLVALGGPPVPGAEKLKANEVVAKSLDAIGPEQARAAVKSLLVEGTIHVKFLMGGSGEAAGPFTFVSAGNKLSFESKFDVPNYPGELFAFDGDKKSIGYVTPGQRSQLEDLLDHNGEIVQEGLIGGVLSTAWPLYDWQARKAKLDSDGMKKEDGKDLYRLTYHPRHGGGDLKIYLFFDPENFRHVKTVYSQQVSGQIGTAPGGLSSGAPGRLTLEENFGGFTNVNGLMLPTQWMWKYTSEGSTGLGSFILEYDMAVTRIEPNADVAGKTFKVQQ